MCPLCWAAMVAQAVFFVAAGVFLVVITDFKFGLPLAFTTGLLAAGSAWWGWGVPSWVLYTLVGAAAVRGIWVLIAREDHWVRQFALWIGGRTRVLLRPVVHCLKRA